MISRKTTAILAQVYQAEFSYRDGRTYSIGRPRQLYKVSQEELFDFLFAHDYPSWFCQKVKTLEEKHEIKEFIMSLHTGELEIDAFSRLTSEQRSDLGQQYLLSLASDMLSYCPQASNSQKLQTIISDLINSLQRDGYAFTNGKLQEMNQELVDTIQESNILYDYYKALNLPNIDTAFHHLQLSNDHYKTGKWEDSIANARKFLEAVLREVAVEQARKRGGRLDHHIYRKPALVRNYLQRYRLLEPRESELIDVVYAMLSEKGAHPYVAKQEHARLLTNMTVTITQFVLLRLQS